MSTIAVTDASFAADVLKSDKPVLVDFWAEWCGPCKMIGPALEEISDELAGLVRACERALWHGLAVARPGRRLTDISHAVETSVRASGAYGIVTGYGGHGIGTDMHLDPQIPNYSVRDTGPKLVHGFTAAIEPMVTAGRHDVRLADDHWAIYSQDGSLAAHFEFTIAVGPDGPRILTPEGLLYPSARELPSLGRGVGHAVFGWVWPAPFAALSLIAAGLLGGIGQILLTSSYREADASLVAPFDYASMIFSLGIGLFVFGEVPTLTMMTGAALVVTAGILIIWRERQLGLERAKAYWQMTLNHSSGYKDKTITAWNTGGGVGASSLFLSFATPAEDRVAADRAIRPSAERRIKLATGLFPLSRSGPILRLARCCLGRHADRNDPVQQAIGINRAEHVIVGTRFNRTTAAFTSRIIDHHGDMRIVAFRRRTQTPTQFQPGDVGAQPIDEGPDRPVPQIGRGLIGERTDRPAGLTPNELGDEIGGRRGQKKSDRVCHGVRTRCVSQAAFLAPAHDTHVTL